MIRLPYRRSVSRPFDHCSDYNIFVFLNFRSRNARIDARWKANVPKAADVRVSRQASRWINAGSLSTKPARSATTSTLDGPALRSMTSEISAHVFHRKRRIVLWHWIKNDYKIFNIACWKKKTNTDMYVSSMNYIYECNVVFFKLLSLLIRLIVPAPTNLAVHRIVPKKVGFFYRNSFTITGSRIRSR